MNSMRFVEILFWKVIAWSQIWLKWFENFWYNLTEILALTSPTVASSEHWWHRCSMKHWRTDSVKVFTFCNLTSNYQCKNGISTPTAFKNIVNLARCISDAFWWFNSLLKIIYWLNSQYFRERWVCSFTFFLNNQKSNTKGEYFDGIDNR